jgi:hypothetical protein
LGHWEAEHVQPVPLRDREQEARQLAVLCLDDALRVGISEEDLRAAAGGDLVNNMLQALNEIGDEAAN